MTKTALTPSVALALLRAARALNDVAGQWTEEDQDAWDASQTPIATALGMSLDEVAATIHAFLEENA